MSAATVYTSTDDHDTPLKPLEGIYFDLGRALSARGQYDKAIEALENALKGDGTKAYAIKARREMAKAFGWRETLTAR
jgi:tetratricopeptide (TPR) repeat protein